jgi:uncharacterized protein (TIGR03435 family)
MQLAMRLVVFLIGAISLPATTAFTQSTGLQAQASPLPTFDVASIRPMSYDDDARSHIYNPSHNSEFKAVNVTLRALLEVAYDLPETQMFGGPAWTTTDKFDLEAKSDAKFSEQMAALSSDQGKQAKRQMLQALLADRFKLAAHTEAREMPVYALVVAKGGSKLVKSSVSGTALSGGRGRISIKGGDDSLAVLAFELSWRLGRPVIDQTGLEGRYGLTLTWTADDGASPASDASNGPSLFTAIQEQLGLKLEPTKGPVPVLVIDHAEKPSEN